MTLDQALETPPWKSTASGMNELLVVARGWARPSDTRTPNGLRMVLLGAKQRDNQGGVAYRGSVIATVARDLGASLGTELPGYGSADDGWIAP
jgi:hypothetical protein